RALADPVDIAVPGDPEQPRLAIRSLFELMELPERLMEALLGEVLRISFVATKMQRESIHCVQVRQRDLLEESRQFLAVEHARTGALRRERGPVLATVLDPRASPGVDSTVAWGHPSLLPAHPSADTGRSQRPRTPISVRLCAKNDGAGWNVPGRRPTIVFAERPPKEKRPRAARAAPRDASATE